MVEVVSIQARRAQPACVERLRDALQRAESGEIQAIALTWITDTEITVTGWGGEFRPCQLLGSIEWLKCRFVRDVVEPL